VALITGGDCGIGRSVAVLYAREGADVAIVYLPEEQSDAEETREAVEKEGRSCAELGGLNVLVSNAAYLNSQDSLADLTAEDFDRVFKTNVYAYFHLVMAALPHLSHGDAIIATASEEALKGSETMMDYAASKAALVVFSKSIASHLAERGVRANVVSGTHLDGAQPRGAAVPGRLPDRPGQFGPHGARRPAGGGGSGVRVPGLRRGLQLHRR
jgi:NAD(P)-dependent dehydrogenase (short-subunit alcohol dehydrogenase family)